MLLLLMKSAFTTNESNPPKEVSSNHSDFKNHSWHKVWPPETCCEVNKTLLLACKKVGQFITI